MAGLRDDGWLETHRATIATAIVGGCAYGLCVFWRIHNPEATADTLHWIETTGAPITALGLSYAVLFILKWIAAKTYHNEHTELLGEIAKKDKILQVIGKTCEKVTKERDDYKFKSEKYESSIKRLEEELKVVSSRKVLTAAYEDRKLRQNAAANHKLEKWVSENADDIATITSMLAKFHTACAVPNPGEHLVTALRMLQIAENVAPGREDVRAIRRKFDEVKNQLQAVDEASIQILIDNNDYEKLIGVWVCSSVQFPTGLFLFRTFDFRADNTFRSIDSLSERPPVRVWDGNWEVVNGMIDLRCRTWSVGAEDKVDYIKLKLRFGFVEGMENVFEIIVPYSSGPVDFICSPSLDDIISRNLVDLLARDIERARSQGGYFDQGESNNVQNRNTADALKPTLRRNDLCSCGSGKRYKHCHGALA